MGAFLSVGKGSNEPSIFLEMKYSGAEDSDSSPLIFVGKGKSKIRLCTVLKDSSYNLGVWLRKISHTLQAISR